MEMQLDALQAHGHNVSTIGTSRERGIHFGLQRNIPTWRVGLRNIYWPCPDKNQPRLARQLWHLIDIYNFAMQGPLGQVLDTERPDVVIVHNLAGWSIAALSAIRARKIPIVQILHDYYSICANSMMFENKKNCVWPCVLCRMMRAPHRVLTNGVDAVIGVSQYVLDRHLAHGTFTKVPIRRVIHNVASAKVLGLDEAPALRMKAQAERGDISIRFGFIGTLAPNKGIEYLLGAFVKLNNPRAELWIAGTGKADYVGMLKSKFESRLVRFLGQMKPKDFFSGIDITVVPSLWQENFPGVVLESFAFGVPVIGSRRGGIPEIITDSKTGLIFDYNQADSLINAMRHCMENFDEIGRMSIAASVASLKFLDMVKWYDAYSEIIKPYAPGSSCLN